MPSYNPQLPKLIPRFDSHRVQTADPDFHGDSRVTKYDFLFGGERRVFFVPVDRACGAGLPNEVRATTAPP